MGREGQRERGGKGGNTIMGVWLHRCAPAYNGTLCATYNVHNARPYPQINFWRVHNNHTCCVLLWALSLSIFIPSSL